MKRNTSKTKELVLTGNPAEDFSSFLKSRSKSFEFGLLLIKTYTRNMTLYNFLKDRQNDRKAKKQLIYNINIIAQKWLKN